MNCHDHAFYLDCTGGEFTATQFHEAMKLSDCDRIDLEAIALRAKETLSDKEKIRLSKIENMINEIE